MTSRIVKKDLTEIIGRARETAKNSGREICGLLIYNGHFIEILQTRNACKTDGHSLFDQKQIRTIMKAAKELNHEIVGIFHSHPAYFAKPGDSDITGSLDDSLMVIIDCIGNEAKLWRIKNGKPRKAGMEIVEL